MAIWIYSASKAMDRPEDVQFDDGLTSKPGEPGFTRDKADAWAKSKGYAAKDVNYVGTPNWVAPVVPDAPAA